MGTVYCIVTINEWFSVEIGDDSKMDRQQAVQLAMGEFQRFISRISRDDAIHDRPGEKHINSIVVSRLFPTKASQ